MQEPKQFNDFLRYLCKFCKEKKLGSFHDFLASKELTLITKTEAADRLKLLSLPRCGSSSSIFLYFFSWYISDLIVLQFVFLSSEVTEDEARSFVVKSEPM